MSIFLISLTIVWFIRIVYADIYLTNNTSLERFPIVAASMLWPVAVIVAIIRITISGSSGVLK